MSERREAAHRGSFSRAHSGAHGHAQLGLEQSGEQQLRDPLSSQRLLQAQLDPSAAAASQPCLRDRGKHGRWSGGSAVQRVPFH